MPDSVRRLVSIRPAQIGCGLLLLLALVALLAPWIAPHNPVILDGAPLQPPSSSYLLGTDELGRDILSRLMFGARGALTIAIGSAVIAAVAGTPLGLMAGYWGGWLDTILMRLTDVLLAIPTIIVALVVLLILGQGELGLILAIASSSVPGFTRLARASTLSVRNTDYVLAARSMGAGAIDIQARSIFPNILSPLLVQLVVTASVAIIASAALNFLGLGTQPPEPTWGAMLQSSRTYLSTAPLYAVSSGVCVVLAVAALDGIGQGLQLAFGLAAGGRARAQAVA